MASFTAVTFLAAFLLFLVQPLLAKAVVPWFGGSSSVWTTSLVFYQTLLLAGYLYAHVSRRLSLRVQASAHLLILVVSLLALPILPGAGWKPTGTEDPALHLLSLLAVCVGAPYLLLASTSPLLHDWFARRFPGRSPYFLYAVSNTGSLLALLAYPFVFEPLVAVDGQAWGWGWAYLLFVLGMAWIVVSLVAGGADGRLAGRASQQSGGRDDPSGVGGTPPSRGRVTLWFLLAACGSGLLLGITNQMTLDVASVPFLWVMPLAIYLTTFILAFAGLYSRSWFGWALAGALAVELSLHAGYATVPLLLQVVGGAAVLFVACMVCHGELARSAPPPEHLTTFYLTMAAGGAVGGATVSLLAPVVLPDFWELPAFLVLAWILLGAVLWTDPGSSMAGGRRSMAWRGMALVMVSSAMGFVFLALSHDAGTLDRDRNFYGVLRVLEGESPEAGPVRGLRHGRILHGSQLQDPEGTDPGRLASPTAYYGLGSGVHLAIRGHPRRQAGLPLRIGVIGQGVGTIAAYGEAGDTVRFFEINPAVDRFAREYFTFMSDSRATIEVTLGDGRLSLEREVERGLRRYHVLVVDAFSGDAIPTHLLTREAGELYWRVLEEDGILAFHVTNRHLDLSSVVRGMASHTGHEVVRVERDAEPRLDVGFSRWFLVTADPEPLLDLGGVAEASEPSRLWTDRFSNLLHVIG